MNRLKLTQKERGTKSRRSMTCNALLFGQFVVTWSPPRPIREARPDVTTTAHLSMPTDRAQVMSTQYTILRIKIQECRARGRKNGASLSLWFYGHLLRNYPPQKCYAPTALNHNWVQWCWWSITATYRIELELPRLSELMCTVINALFPVTAVCIFINLYC